MNQTSVQSVIASPPPRPQPEPEPTCPRSLTLLGYNPAIIQPRSGQEECWEFVANNPDRKSYLFVLAPAYGKTWALIGCYGVARAQGYVNRLMVIVANRLQRRQMVRALIKEGRDILVVGGPLKGVVALDKKSANVLIANRRNQIDAVVTTYSQLVEKLDWFEGLFTDGNWMIVRDEVHHNAEGKPWGDRSNRLIEHPNVKKVVDLTGTGVRTDRKYLTGIRYREASDGAPGEVEYVADVDVEVLRGMQEGAIRSFVGRIQNYLVDVEIEGEGCRQVSTDELKEATENQASKTRRGIRIAGDYINRMLEDAIEELDQKNRRHPAQHQGLIWALNQEHARIILRHLRALYGKNSVADWIGVARSDEENETVLDRYLGIKSGLRVDEEEEIPPSERLLWLVQVAKAGEGFNNPRCSVLVFMNLVAADAPVTQNLLRGGRRNKNIPQSEDFCSVYASTDSPIAEKVRSLEAASQFKDKVEGTGTGGGGGGLPEFKTVEVTRAQWTRTDVHVTNGIANPLHLRAEAAAVEDVFRRVGLPIPNNATDDQLRQLAAQLAGLHPAAVPALAPTAPRQASPTLDFNGAIESLRQNVLDITRTIAVIAGRVEGDRRLSKIGERMKIINTRWLEQGGQRHDTMTVDQTQQKFDWLKGVHDTLRQTRRVPAWLR